MPFNLREYIRMIAVSTALMIATVAFVFLIAPFLIGLPEWAAVLSMFVVAIVWCFGAIVPAVFWLMPWVMRD